MLGLSTGLVYGEHLQDPEGVIHNSDINPSENTGIIAWYDWSDVSTLRTPTPGESVDNGDDIYSINNKVTHNTRLGNFSLSFTKTGSTLTFATGGANGKSYGDFNGLLTQTEVTEASSTYHGNLASTTMPSASINEGPLSNGLVNSYAGITFFFVVDPHSDTASTSTDKTLFSFKANGDAGSSNYTGINLKVEANDDQWNIGTYDGTGPFQFHDADIDVATGVQLLTLRFRDDGDRTAAGTFYIDGDTNSAYTIDMSDVGSAHVYPNPFGVSYLNNASNFRIGKSAGTNAKAAGFKGKIYESILYNKGLSDANCTLIENHLKTKYGIS